MKYFLLLVLLLIPFQSFATIETDISLESVNSINDSKKNTTMFEYKKGNFKFNESYSYAEINDDQIHNKSVTFINYNPDINNDWSLWLYEELIIDNQNDDIINENLAGLGIKYLLYRSDTIKTDLSYGIIEHLINYENLDNENLERHSLRFRLDKSIKLVEFKSTIYYQPNTANTDDYIIKGLASIRVGITKETGIKLSYISEIRSLVGEDDIRTILSVTYRR